jgi:hypothetical protein
MYTVFEVLHVCVLWYCSSAAFRYHRRREEHMETMSVVLLLLAINRDIVVKDLRPLSRLYSRFEMRISVPRPWRQAEIVLICVVQAGGRELGPHELVE